MHTRENLNCFQFKFFKVYNIVFIKTLTEEKKSANHYIIQEIYAEVSEDTKTVGLYFGIDEPDINF